MPACALHVGSPYHLRTIAKACKSKNDAPGPRRHNCKARRYCMLLHFKNADFIPQMQTFCRSPISLRRESSTVTLLRGEAEVVSVASSQFMLPLNYICTSGAWLHANSSPGMVTALRLPPFANSARQHMPTTYATRVTDKNSSMWNTLVKTCS